MGIESTLADLKGEQLSELPKVTIAAGASTGSNSVANRNRNRNRDRTRQSRKIRRRQKNIVVSPVQRLYETCKDVFAIGGTGVVPSPEKIERLKAVLDGIKPEDVSLMPEHPYFHRQVGRKYPAITYQHIYECDKFSMGIFCLPPDGVIPLHNHPGMTVFSKLLFGTMHIKSYDWVPGNTSAEAVNVPGNTSAEAVDVPGNTTAAAVDVPGSTSADMIPSETKKPEVRLAKVKVNSEHKAPCNTSILYPADGGNMHCFTAVTACAVLDVLGPPYSDPEGRHCTYYQDFPFANFSVDGVSVPEEEQEGYAWLQEGEEPEDLMVTGSFYNGPDIVEK